MANKLPDLLKAEALRLVREGYHVVPLSISGGQKYPLMRWNEKDGSWFTTEDDVNAFSSWYYATGIGIILEAPFREINGKRYVRCEIDLDRHGVDGVASFEALCLEHNYDYQSATRISRTASGGLHLDYWCEVRPGEKITKRLGFIPGADGLCGHNLTIVPPSVKISDDRTEYPYEYINDADIAVIPDWLDLLALKRSVPRPRIPAAHIGAFRASHDGTRLQSYFVNALNGCITELAGEAKGNRNNLLFTKAARIYNIVEACGWAVSDAEIEAAFMGAMSANGYIADKGSAAAEKSFNSGRTRGLNNPEIPELTDFDSRVNVGTVAHASDASVDDDDEAGTNTVISLPPAAPIDVLPEEFRDFVSSVSESFQATPIFAFGALLSLLGSMIGRARQIEIKQTWTAYATLPLITVAASSVGKSPVLKFLFRVVKEIEAEMEKTYREELARYKSEKQKYDEAVKAGTVGDTPPTAPIRGVLTSQNATREALERRLCDNAKGILLINDEIVSFLLNLKRLGGGDDSSFKAALIELLDGSSIGSDRVDEERTRYAEHALLSMMGGIQPGRLAASFGSEDFDSGFLPRFLLLRGVIEKPAVFDTPEIPAKLIARYETLVRHCHALQLTPNALTGKAHPAVVRLSAEARGLFGRIYDRVNALAYDLQGVDDVQTSSLRKSLNQLASVTLVLHEIDCFVTGEDDVSTPVPASTIQRAYRVVQWAAEHRRQCFAMFGSAKTTMQPAAQDFYDAVTKAVENGKSTTEGDSIIISNADLQSCFAHRTGEKDKAFTTRVGLAAKAAKAMKIKAAGVRSWRIPKAMLSSLTAADHQEAALPPLPEDYAEATHSVREIDEDTLQLI